ncbi:hypothetical protein HS088_TW11G00529 [Tripterygium wilfordii]|uniref:FIGL1 N-terminal domain-containing protein n=1 Tax=Tripterygium wilfordii TaxID=458696 RepID=A0A7J7D2A3_TRIWF|nr:hypothetical protein HS088_TW11G00529 [Tripterygium wilfordii]
MKKEGRCWRKEVDEKLRRLHSLCFGADHALERHDYESAHSTLGLSLVGFLDSTSITLANEFLARQIRLDAASKVYQARHALTPESDRQAFEQAERAPGTTFRMKGEIDIEKIK